MLHAAYVKMFSNPFYSPGEKITSKWAANKIVKIIILVFVHRWFEQELSNIYEQSKYATE